MKLLCFGFKMLCLFPAHPRRMPWHSRGAVSWHKAPFPCRAVAGAVLSVPHTHTVGWYFQAFNNCGSFTSDGSDPRGSGTNAALGAIQLREEPEQLRSSAAGCLLWESCCCWKQAGEPNAALAVPLKPGRRLTCILQLRLCSVPERSGDGAAQRRC